MLGTCLRSFVFAPLDGAGENFGWDRISAAARPETKTTPGEHVCPDVKFSSVQCSICVNMWQNRKEIERNVNYCPKPSKIAQKPVESDRISNCRRLGGKSLDVKIRSFVGPHFHTGRHLRCQPRSGKHFAQPTASSAPSWGTKAQAERQGQLINHPRRHARAINDHLTELPNSGTT